MPDDAHQMTLWLHLVQLDVTDDASIARAVSQGIAAFGNFDVLVNNAGIGLFSAFEITPRETVREVFEANTLGATSRRDCDSPPVRTATIWRTRVGTAPMNSSFQECGRCCA
jgi:NAD(P)-dependent dehydrogenase (short-subunit alcohol dehydrogenase family)